jgi:hypothetical protein
LGTAVVVVGGSSGGPARSPAGPLDAAASSSATVTTRARTQWEPDGARSDSDLDGPARGADEPRPLPPGGSACRRPARGHVAQLTNATLGGTGDAEGTPKCTPRGCTIRASLIRHAGAATYRRLTLAHDHVDRVTAQ